MKTHMMSIKSVPKLRSVKAAPPGRATAPSRVLAIGSAFAAQSHGMACAAPRAM